MCISLFKPKSSPVTFTKLEISGDDLRAKIVALGFTVPLGMFDSAYIYTDPEGWAKVLSDMTFKSNLYKTEVFDCEDYAMKACVICWERYGLNAFGFLFGMTPAGYHGFNIFYDGLGFTLHEPNEGFDFGGPFPVGEHGYLPSMIVI